MTCGEMVEYFGRFPSDRQIAVVIVNPRLRAAKLVENGQMMDKVPHIVFEVGADSYALEDLFVRVEGLEVTADE